MQTNLAETLTTIATHAPKLRAAGVQSLSVDGIAMVLAPPEPPASPEQASTQDDEPKGMLEDTSTYGLPDGADVPGFQRPEDLPRKA